MLNGCGVVIYEKDPNDGIIIKKEIIKKEISIINNHKYAYTIQVTGQPGNIKYLSDNEYQLGDRLTIVSRSK